MKKSILLATTLTASVLMLTACGSQPAQPTATTAQETVVPEISLPETTVLQSDRNIPPIAGYDFNMTRQDINSKLGTPYEVEDDGDVYYHVDFLGMDGHLSFSYENDKVSGVYWTSPVEKYSESQCSECVEIVTEYFNGIYGSAESAVDDQTRMYIWTDSFNKIDVWFMQTSVDDGIQFDMVFMKHIEIKEVPTLSEEDLQELEEALNELERK